ncbi:MAG: tetratricopeptide repeat protein [Bacteroidota bacterium]
MKHPSIVFGTKYLLLLFAFVLLPSLSHAQVEPAAGFEAANKLYQEKDYKGAAERYEAIHQAGHQSLASQYNLGNCYYNLGQLGRAILHYERAALLESGDKDVRYNLNLANRQLQDEFSEIPSFFLSRWWTAVHSSMRAKSWTVLLLVLSWMGVGALFLWILGRQRQQRKYSFLIGCSCLLLAALCWGLSSSQRSFEQQHPYGIILSAETQLRSGPDAASTELLPLHEGTKVRILDQLGDWKKVRLPDGDQGWLADKVIERI